METDHRVPLIRTTGEFGYLTKSRLSEDPKRLDSPKMALNFNAFQFSDDKISRLTAHGNYPVVPRCENTESLIKQLSTSIQEIFPKVVNSPYSFTDVKIMKDESHAIAVTNEGYAVYVDINNNTFEEELLSHHPLASILTCRNDTLAFVKERDLGKIYCLELPNMKVKKTLKVLGETTNGIGRMSLSPDERYLFARLWKGEIVRWDINLLGNYEILLSEKNVSCMNISPDGIAVVGTLDKKIILYSLSFEKISEKSVNFIVDAFINFSESGHLIILGMEKVIKLIEKDTLEQIFEFNVGCQANDCRMTQDNKYVIAALESGHLAFFSTEFHSKELRIKIHDSSIQSIHVTADQRKIYTFGSDCKLSHVQFPKLSMFLKINDIEVSQNSNYSLRTDKEHNKDNSISIVGKEENELFKPICIAVTPSHQEIIAGGESNKIYIFKSSNKEKCAELIGHHDYVYSLVVISEKFLASGSADHSVIIWNLMTLAIDRTLLGHIGPVTALAKIEMAKIVSGSQDRTVKIWAWEQSILLYTISEIPEPVAALTVPRYNRLLVGTKKLIQCWSLDSFSLIFEKKCDKDLKSFKLVESGVKETKRFFFALGDSEGDHLIENPFSCTEVNYWGPDEGKTYEMLTYIRDMMMGKIPAYDSDMDLWFISPYNINILHFYAYFNIPEYLGQSISNGTPLISSISNSNPLTIALEMKYKECVEVIIKSAWKRYSYNSYTFAPISVDTILDLNRIDTYLLPKLYKLIVNKPYSAPKYCSRKTKLPIVSLNFSQTLIPKFLVGGENLEGNEVEIRFLQTTVPLYLNPGSRKSIEFLQSLINCKQPEVFATELIQTVLKFKWDKVKFLLLMEWVLFMAYFLYLIGGIIAEFGVIDIFAIYSIGAVVFLFNFYALCLSHSFSCWFLVDFLRFSLLTLYFLYFVIDLSEFDDHKSHILISVVSVSFIQGFYFFKLFKSTRNIIRIATDIFKESLNLLFLLFYILLAASVIIYINSNETSATAKSSVFGLYAIPDISKLQDLFSIFLSYIAPGIIFIALLAISTHNYDLSPEISRKLEYIEIASIVLKGECLKPWNRNDDWSQYVQVCTHEKFIGVDRVKKIAKAVKLVKHEQDQHRFEIMDGFAEIREKLEAVHGSIKEIKKEKRIARKK